MALGQYRAVLVDTLWYWVSIGQNCFELGGTGSVWSRGWYWSLLDGTGSVKAVLVVTWLYWVSMGRYKLVLCATGSV